MSEWKEYKFSDIAEVIGGGTPDTFNVSYWNGDIPWLTPKDLTGYSKIYISKGERNITSDGLKNSSAKLLPKDTVLLTTRAPIGYVAIAENEIATNQGFKNFVLKKDYADCKFVYYWLKNNIDYLRSIGTGTTFAEISGSVVKEIKILLPPLSEQKSIASILSSLDDKIDLLHRQNATLEKMAETLFRQWFIEDAKEEWEIAKMESLISIGSGKGLKKESFIENGLYPILGANGEIGRTNEFIFDEKLIYTGRVGTLGNIFRIENEKVWLSDNTLVIKPLGFFNFIYFTLKNSHLEDYDVGSTQPLIRQSDIKEIEVVLPPIEILKEFESIANKVFQKIKSNQTQIRTLTALRDTLLPKLMSGEIRVL
jgi:type I restriction enzyme S subunit